MTTRKRAITDHSTGTDRALRALLESYRAAGQEAEVSGDDEAAELYQRRQAHLSRLIGDRQRRRNLEESRQRLLGAWDGYGPDFLR